MFNIEIKKTSEADFFPHTYFSITLNDKSVNIEIKIHNNRTEINFLEDNSPQKKYEISHPKKILINEKLELIDNHNYLNYCYESKESTNNDDCILNFEFPFTHLQKHEGKYKLKFNGENKNNSNNHGHNLHPEEGIIIFEPPPEKEKKEKQKEEK